MSVVEIESSFQRLLQFGIFLLGLGEFSTLLQPMYQMFFKVVGVEALVPHLNIKALCTVHVTTGGIIQAKIIADMLQLQIVPFSLL